MDIDRLLHQLILDGYLQEKMVPTKMEGIVASYIKLGPKANELLGGNVKVKPLNVGKNTICVTLNIALCTGILKEECQ